MTAWVPEWRITVGDDVYTTVTSTSLTTGRTDIDRQPNAGYSRVEIINTTGAAFTIDVGDAVLLELKNSAGTYVPVFGGAVTDFTIGVRSPEETGYVTYGTVLAIGSLARLAKYIYTAALAEGLDGAQIATILGEALDLSWAEVTPTLTWATYPPLVTWEDAESYVGTVDSGVYTMIATTAEDVKAENLADQIATSALGQLYEEKGTGNVNYDDADHRENYLNTYGYTSIDGSYATPASVRSLTQVAKIRNSLIYKYGASYGSTYSTSDADSIATYGRYEYRVESNIKTLANITAVGTREIQLRAVPYAQFASITFRLDNADMPSATRNTIINTFFGQPIEITNLPSNMFGGTFKGFVEGYSLSSTPTYVDLTLTLSPAKFSLPVDLGDYALAETYTADATYTVPSGVTQLSVFLKGKGGNGANGAFSGTNGGAGGGGGGGGGAGAFWNYDVIAGQTYAVAFNTGSTNRVSFGSLMSISPGADGSGSTPGSSGGLFSVDPSIVFYDAETGTPAGAGGSQRTTNGNGFPGSNSSGNGSLLTVPSNLGLPQTIRAGGGGGGGGGGARDATGIGFRNGGIAGSGGALDGNNGGGSGGAALQDFNLDGASGGSGVLGNGGGGGGGGAYQLSYGLGTGGTGSSGTGAVVYIYTR
jgi:uncharacterized membrane protein YgcG